MKGRKRNQCIKATCGFCLTAYAGSTKPGTPYIMKYTNDFVNLFSRGVLECPSV